MSGEVWEPSGPVSDAVGVQLCGCDHAMSLIQRPSPGLLYLKWQELSICFLSLFFFPFLEASYITIFLGSGFMMKVAWMIISVVSFLISVRWGFYPTPMLLALFLHWRKWGRTLLLLLISETACFPCNCRRNSHKIPLGKDWEDLVLISFLFH